MQLAMPDNTTPVQQWEYKPVISVKLLKAEELNRLGSMGWQMCAFHMTAEKQVYYFQRPKQDK